MYTYIWQLINSIIILILVYQIVKLKKKIGHLNHALVSKSSTIESTPELIKIWHKGRSVAKEGSYKHRMYTQRLKDAGIVVNGD